MGILSYNTKNYNEQGGEKTVIGGTLMVSPGGEVIVEGCLGVSPEGEAIVEGRLEVSPEGVAVVEGCLEIAADAKLILGGKELNLVTGLTDSAAANLDDLISDFNDLLEALYGAGIMAADRTALEASIVAAQELLDEAVEGTDEGEYPAAAIETFTLAVGAAQTVVDDPAATQSVVNGAISTLATAVTAFENEITTG